MFRSESLSVDVEPVSCNGTSSSPAEYSISYTQGMDDVEGRQLVVVDRSDNWVAVGGQPMSAKERGEASSRDAGSIMI